MGRGGSGEHTSVGAGKGEAVHVLSFAGPPGLCACGLVPCSLCTLRPSYPAPCVRPVHLCAVRPVRLSQLHRHDSLRWSRYISGLVVPLCPGVAPRGLHDGAGDRGLGARGPPVADAHQPGRVCVLGCGTRRTWPVGLQAVFHLGLQEGVSILQRRKLRVCQCNWPVVVQLVSAGRSAQRHNHLPRSAREDPPQCHSLPGGGEVGGWR